MKKILAVILICFIGLVGLIHADASYLNNKASLQVQLNNYDPIPVTPGSYFDTWFKITNTGNPASNAKFELKLEYPFYLSQSETPVKTFNSIGNGENILIKYRINVREDALSGDQNITLRITQEDGSFIESNYTIKVAKLETSFDAVIQDASTDLLTLGISNTGKNPAYSVIIKTKGFVESSTVIGTMTSGNYTLLQIPLKEVNTDNPDNSLNVEIDYSDSNGNRKTITKDLQVNNIQTSVDFDTVVQDVTTDGISLGIANVGRNTANAVTVKTGGMRGIASSSLLGNLNAGDYSVIVVQTPQNTTGNFTGRNFTRNQTGFTRSEGNQLTVTISYTTINGYRKIITKQISLDATQGKNTRNLTTTPTTSSTNWWLYIAIILAGVLTYVLYNNKQKR